MLSSLVTQSNPTPKMIVILEDVYLAIASAEESNMLVIPEAMKNVIVDSIYNLKVEVAERLLDQFDVEEFQFEIGDPTFNMLREAVATRTGGEMSGEY